MTAPDVDAQVTKMESALNVRDGVTFPWVTVNAADLRALLAALRVARADGERLDWLSRQRWWSPRDWGAPAFGCDLRTAIDAARAATGDPK